MALRRKRELLAVWSLAPKACVYYYTMSVQVHGLLTWHYGQKKDFKRGERRMVLWNFAWKCCKSTSLGTNSSMFVNCSVFCDVRHVLSSVLGQNVMFGSVQSSVLLLCDQTSLGTYSLMFANCSGFCYVWHVWSSVLGQNGMFGSVQSSVLLLCD